MASPNRGARLTKLVATLKKKFKPTPPAERPLFESLLYACLVENSPHEAGEKALHHLEQNYFDWNEVRVSTRAELAEALRPLVDPLDAADRLKRVLQSVFETVYAFNLDALKKQNLGQAVKQIAGWDGVTPFAVAYVTQNGLGGHAIPVNHGALVAFHALDLISDGEFHKGLAPGLDRAIPKTKGGEQGSLIHQLGVEVGRNPYGPAARKLLLELDPSCKDRLPKKPVKEEPVVAAPVASPAPTAPSGKAAPPAPPAAKAADKPAAKGAIKGPEAAPAKEPAAKDAGAKKPVEIKKAVETKKPVDAKGAAKPKPAPAKPEKAPEKASEKGMTKKPAAKAPEPKSPAAKGGKAMPTVKKPPVNKPPVKKPPAAPPKKVVKKTLPAAKKPTKKPAAPAAKTRKPR